MVVTGEDPCPIEVQNEERSTRYDLETHQEEADIIIVQQVLKCVGEAQSISVISDDTDVFVLLLHHYGRTGSATDYGIPKQRKGDTGHQVDTGKA